MKNIFLTDTYNAEGVFAVNLYIKGKPTIITVDDYIPFSGTSPLGEKKSKTDSDWWAPVLEKVWAKINRNYEGVNWGW